MKDQNPHNALEIVYNADLKHVGKLGLHLWRKLLYRRQDKVGTLSLFLFTKKISLVHTVPHLTDCLFQEIEGTK